MPTTERAMFLVTSAYKVPRERIAEVLPAHVAWVDGLYADGTFVLSGRLVPFTGGFMLATGCTRERLDAILATDPFRVHDLLDHTVTELSPTRWAPELAPLVAQ